MLLRQGWISRKSGNLTEGISVHRVALRGQVRPMADVSPVVQQKVVVTEIAFGSVGCAKQASSTEMKQEGSVLGINVQTRLK